MEECKRKYADMCKEHGALEAECQLLKDQMDEADAKSSKIRDTAEVIQIEESPLVVSMFFVTVILSIKYEVM